MATSWHNLRRLTYGVLIAQLVASPVLGQAQDRDHHQVGRDREAVRSVAKVLVDNGLAVSRETDPVEKAKLFDQVASKLSERANVQAALGDVALAGKLAFSCSRVIEQGIVGNIDDAEFAEDDARARMADALLDGVPKHVTVLRQVLDRVPEPARLGVARAIEASQKRGQGILERLRQRAQRRHGKQGAHEGGEDARKQKGKGRPPWAGGKKKGEGKALGKKGAWDSDHRLGMGKGRGVKKKHSKVEKEVKEGDDRQKGKGRGRGKGKGRGPRDKHEED